MEFIFYGKYFSTNKSENINFGSIFWNLDNIIHDLFFIFNFSNMF
jgi:hypothetical protein